MSQRVPAPDLGYVTPLLKGESSTVSCLQRFLTQIQGITSQPLPCLSQCQPFLQLPLSIRDIRTLLRHINPSNGLFSVVVRF